MSRRSRRRNRSKTYQTRTHAHSYRPSRRLRFDPRIQAYNDRFIQSRRAYTKTYTPTKKTVKSRTSLHITTTKGLKYKNTTPLPYSASPQKIRKALVCAKRKMRTEVMHAKNHAGKGGQKKPRYTPQSKIRC